MSQAPGVYVKIEENPISPRPIEAAGTSTAVFLGPTRVVPENRVRKPIRITRFAQYEDTFGDMASPNDDGGPVAAVDYVRHAVNEFFRNGGTTAYVVSMGNQEGAPEEYDEAFTRLERVRDIGIICLPTQQLGPHPGEPDEDPPVPATSLSNAAVGSAITHAEKMLDRFVLVDPPRDSDLATADMTDGLDTLHRSSHSALFYPWIRVSNPHFNANIDEDQEANPRTVLVPPSGFVAGVWARTDTRRGVWKAPAGVQARLYALTGLQHTVTDAEQATLNDNGVNCIRQRPGYGTVVWGARTLATEASLWQYIPVRRTAMMLRESIEDGIQWAVFEPNNDSLWSALRLTIESFMNGLFRAGAFQGQRASEAYFVRCGLGDTMEQGDIDGGFVKVVVGFAPVKPAEFVEVTIYQQVGLQQGA